MPNSKSSILDSQTDGMVWRAYISQEDCISCGACVSHCPNGAIYLWNDKYSVDTGTCHFVQSCFSSCPADAIYPIQVPWNSI
ncbi:MAG: 4Fe-4S binding protein [Ignavibacteriaceae bacterium]|nr:4Fe-4S binding protein [Ignavibacteriaceae bacterium]